ncbi:nucleotidyltransferase family protein [Novosphingobium sp. B 225]|uniref:nucleotidyltransferase family protein n=1 Tax=Novosphingobium sp. B 225 TaxID=1961849 RepID=UPI000B4B2A0D|nr:nucleotidyltransferase domain-containing protein [Novosphingobium sp. B 225]
MTGRLLLSAAELAEVRAILARHLDRDVQVFAFGSRAGGHPKPWSDLDLALSGPDLIPISLMARLAEDFSESSLPWKVDLVDLAGVSREFAAIIDSSKVPI